MPQHRSDTGKSPEALPPEFLRELEQLEAAYLASSDPRKQSGFGGGAERWRLEREPILDAVTADGEILDAGCANGYLLECLVEWGRERGLQLTPYGLDIGAELIELARARMPQHASSFFAGNALDWTPPRRFRYVYTLYDTVPAGFLERYVRRLLGQVVAPGGRLIVGAYGSRSRGLPPFDVAGALRGFGLEVAGTASGGDPPLTVFAWVDAAPSET